MKLSKNFSLAELTASDWAARHGVDNTPPAVSAIQVMRIALLVQGRMWLSSTNSPRASTMAAAAMSIEYKMFMARLLSCAARRMRLG